nr:conjugal transfer protein TraO [Chitinophaga sp. GbtcB8]
MVFLVQGRVKALWGTSREQFRPSAGIGLRVNF